ncbi:hypothetical protein ABZS66_28045 [Dactylosporangium sp. NPDC005572]|uniref:hypothetical protein n=1 Tax=Dactylosporangium sp. NPDC005572 TaxID=3156889 RepID=UPI0033A5A320
MTPEDSAEKRAGRDLAVANEPLVGENLPRGPAISDDDRGDAQVGGVVDEAPQVRILGLRVRREEDKPVGAVGGSDAHRGRPRPDAAVLQNLDVS